MTRTLALASHPVLKSAVKNVRLLLVFYDESRWAWAYRKSRRHRGPPELADPGREDKEALDQAHCLIELQKASDTWLALVSRWTLSAILVSFGSLNTLALDTLTRQSMGRADLSTREIPEGMNWQRLWPRCTRALTIIMWSVINSGISITSLSLFDGNNVFPICGKVSCNMLSMVLRDLAISCGGKLSWVRPVKSLTLSFSTYTSESPPFDEQLDPLTHDRDLLCRPLPSLHPFARTMDHFQGPCQFLRLVPRLEALDLRMYSTLRGLPNINQNALYALPLTCLRRLTLRGIWTHYTHLLSVWYQNLVLEMLDLREVHLHGSPNCWTALFRQLSEVQRSGRSVGGPLATRPRACLRALHLENLFDESNHLVNLAPLDPAFDDGMRGVGRSFPTRRGDDIVHTRDISMGELAAGLRFRVLPNRHGRGSAELRWWLRERRVLYGPPDTTEIDKSSPWRPLA